MARTGRVATVSHSSSGRARFIIVRPSRPPFGAGMVIQAVVPLVWGSAAGGPARPTAPSPGPSPNPGGGEQKPSPPTLGGAGGGGLAGKVDGSSGVQSNNYWSSTTYAPNTTNAWNVNLNDGNVNNDNKTNTNYVWPVRGGE